MLPDSFHTIAAASEGEFKDRGSRFIGYAYPVAQEVEALAFLEHLKKEHFKARHHCYAWRFGVDGLRFRANDDGEPSGTAGRPILGQIDTRGLTDVLIVVVRYFGGTLLGASGLIHAYRESASLALQNATIVEKIITTAVSIDFDYAVMPDLMHSIKKLDISIAHEIYGDRGQVELAIRKNDLDVVLLKLKSSFMKISLEEAAVRPLPEDINIVIKS